MQTGKLKPWFFGTILLYLIIQITQITIVSTHSINLNKISNQEVKNSLNDRIEESSAHEHTHAHSRQKRLLWITSDGRLALPPGTSLVITPSLSLPFVRYPPDGFFSNLTISLPFTIDFNKLGLTDNENPYGVLPPIFARSMGNTAANMLGEYVMQMLKSGNRAKRSTMSPNLANHDAFHGGERALLYVAAQEFIENFGMNGKACLLRAICEVQAHPMSNYGLFGEMLKLFLTASKSPYSPLMREYVEAEEAGSGRSGPAECWPYLKDCPKSLFMQKHNKYSENQEVDELDDSSMINKDGIVIKKIKAKVTLDQNNISE